MVRRVAGRDSWHALAASHTSQRPHPIRASQVRASTATRNLLGSGSVLTPVRRSARASDGMAPVEMAALLRQTNYSYVPNPLLRRGDEGDEDPTEEDPTEASMAEGEAGTPYAAPAAYQEAQADEQHVDTAVSQSCAAPIEEAAITARVAAASHGLPSKLPLPNSVAKVSVSRPKAITSATTQPTRRSTRQRALPPPK